MKGREVKMRSWKSFLISLCEMTSFLLTSINKFRCINLLAYRESAFLFFFRSRLDLSVPS